MLLANFVALGSSSPATSAAATSLPSDVESAIRQRIDNGETVGVMVALIDEQGTRFYAFGKPAKGSDQPLDQHTLFEIGSVTKVFTAIVYEQLVQEGKLQPDAPVSRYLPAGTKLPEYDGRPITVESLVSHTSSLPRMPDNFEPRNPLDPYADYTVDRLYAFLAGCKLERPIGSKYEYSNVGMGLLGHVLERVTGQSYEQLIVARICKPLGMNDTRITLNADQLRRFAKGHAGDREVLPWTLNSLAGAGALRSTAEDMATFVAAAIGTKPTELTAVIERTTKPRFAAGDDLQIAHGWHVFTRFDTEIIWHNGSTGGFRSWCGYRPDRKCGAVVLCNSTHEIDDVGRHLLEPRWELKPIRPVIDVPPEELEQYVGDYEFAPGEVFHVLREGSQLYAELNGQDRYPVFAEAPAKFFCRVVDAQLTFIKDEKGKVTGLILHQADRSRNASRKK